MRGLMGCVTAVCAVLAGAVVAPLGGTAVAGPAAPVPVAVPAQTPNVTDGQVNAIEKIGNTVVVGGTFTSATPAGGGAPVSRAGILAYDGESGAISDSFAPTLNGAVQDIEPGPVAGTVYVVGRFNRVDGVNHNKVALLNLSDGQPVEGFKAAAINGVVNSAEQRDGRLFIGGFFTTVGEEAHGGLATLNASTGRLDPYVSTQLTENHNNTGGGAVGPVGVREFDISPANDRLVAVGNFRKADGLDRDQVVMLSLGSANASVTDDWQTNRFKPLCFSWAFDHYVRGVDFAPNGEYFVVATTGGYGAGTLCDAASRFETYSSGNDLQPQWVNYSGGDTLWSVEVTEAAVFVGGHQRWMNNSLAGDRAGAGAVPRPGLAALNTRTGMPLAWNPGRNPRGAAVFDIHAADDRLLLGSDTEYIGNRQYFRGRVASFPLAGGALEAPDTTATLPGTVLVGNSGLSGMDFDGTTAGTLTPLDPMGFDWRTTKGAFLAGGKLYYAATDGMFYRRRFDGSTLGQPEPLTPWADPVWAGVPTGSGNTFDGAASRFYSQIPSLTSLTYANGRIYYTLAKKSALYSRWFNVDSGVVGADEFTVSTGLTWRSVTSVFVGGDRLYYVNNGALYAVPLEAATSGGAMPAGTLVTHQNLRGTVFLSSEAGLANEPPHAAFTSTCDALACSFDASSSTDPDGSIASYDWAFGDGGTDTTSAPSHTYGAGGAYTVTLTVTDNRGVQTSTSNDVHVADVEGAAISHVASVGEAANSATPGVTVPAEVQSQDTMLLSAAVSGDVTVAAPPGWALVDRRATIGLTSYLWSRTATASDAGARVSLSLPAIAKSAVTVAAYRGVDTMLPIGGLATSVDASTAEHTSPALEAPSDSTVVSIWHDKSPSTSDWIEPAWTQPRAEVINTGASRVSTLVVDGGGAQSGPVGGLTAVTDVVSNRGVARTIALNPAG